MKFIIALFMLGAVYAAKTDSTENDDLSIEELFSNTFGLELYVDCFLDKSACSDDGFVLKRGMHEAIGSGCSKCDDRQKTMYKIFLKEVQEKFPVKYEEYRNKYDPENKYFDAFLASVADH